MKYVFGFLLALSLVPTLPPVHAANASQNIVLSEIAWAGSARSTADEWVELANIGSSAVDISGWQITGIGSSGSAISIPNGSTLAAGGTYLIANYQRDNTKSTLLATADLITTSVSISNTKLNITVLDSNGTTIDTVADDGTPDYGSASTFATMTRNLDTFAWSTAETSSNLLDGQYGSPGVINFSVVTASIDPVNDDILEDSTSVLEESPVQQIDVTTLTNNDAGILNEMLTDAAPVSDDLAGIVSESALVTPSIAEIIDNAIDHTEEISQASSSETFVEIPLENPTVLETIGPVQEHLAVAEVVEETISVVSDSITIIQKESSSTTPSSDVIVVAPNDSSETSSLVTNEVIATLVTEAPTPSIGASASSIIPTITVGDVIINELLPAPSAGADEWVELMNTTTTNLDLSQLTLVDASGKITTLDGTITAGGYSLVANPNGNLNNTNETLSLVNKEGIVVDTVSYGNDTLAAPKKDTALARIAGVWTTATSTPGTANTNNISTETVSPTTETTSTDTATISPILYADNTSTTSAANVVDATAATPSTSNASPEPSHVVTSVKTVSTNDSTNTASVTTKKSSNKSSTGSSAPRNVSIDDITTIADDTMVSVEGAVVAKTGVLGKRSFFLDGLEIYQSKGALAAVTVGDVVRITGEVSVLSDHRRVNIQEGGVAITGTVTPIVHNFAPTLPYGSLVRATGTVSSRDGNAVILKVGNESITVAPGAGITVSWSDFAGKEVNVTGILRSNSNGKQTLVLRESTDIALTDPASTTAIASTTTTAKTPWWVMPSVVSGTAAAGTWFWWNRPKTSLNNLSLKSSAV